MEPAVSELMSKQLVTEPESEKNHAFKTTQVATAVFLKVPSCRIRSDGGWHHWIDLEKTGCMGTNCNLFRQTGLQKCGRVNNCSMEDGS